MTDGPSFTLDDRPLTAKAGETIWQETGVRTLLPSWGKRGQDSLLPSRNEHGDPAGVIARVAEEGYTLVIVGKHGRNWIEGMVIGSTAAKVCEIAKRPVLMVPLRKG